MDTAKIKQINQIKLWKQQKRKKKAEKEKEREREREGERKKGDRKRKGERARETTTKRKTQQRKRERVNIHEDNSCMETVCPEVSISAVIPFALFEATSASADS